ncbi:hypothetical protein EV294_101346 [Paenibacillus sp. BK033]|uniref:hypothetical protein n=1 Tax=Paenibacillus sp. BK033 TaxID=2512133 RepID=UPI00104C01B8|nr:hypothetical protein [Paenibacillus sp. BK033]TCN00896.1 hypothetical protein EV294_101346 [Paenibacillus sp. BK033]
MNNLSPRPLCKYPGCKLRSHTTFALVPLCNEHNELIRKETVLYYTKKQNTKLAETRPEYRKIEMLIPWSQARMGKRE